MLTEKNKRYLKVTLK